MEKDEKAEAVDAAEANDAWKPGFLRVCVMIIDYYCIYFGECILKFFLV